MTDGDEPLLRFRSMGNLHSSPSIHALLKGSPVLGPSLAQYGSTSRESLLESGELKRRSGRCNTGGTVLPPMPIPNPLGVEHEMRAYGKTGHEGTRVGMPLERIKIIRGVKFCDGQMMNYEPKRFLLWGVIDGIFNPASAFYSKRLLLSILFLVSISGLVFFAAIFQPVAEVENYKRNTETFRGVVTFLHSFTPFLLGLYVSVCVNRWWTIRTDGIGGLWGAIDNFCMMMSLYINQNSEEDKHTRHTVLRYCLLSHALVYKQASEEWTMSDLQEAGMITEEELSILDPLPSKHQVIWEWIAAMASEWRAAGRVPSDIELVTLHNLCLRARDGIGTAFCYTDTQLPFAYFHMISVVVWALGVAQATMTGLVFASHWRADADVMHVTIEIVFCCAIPAVYFALLYLCERLLNPLRARGAADFPATAWYEYMQHECEAFFAISGFRPWHSAPIQKVSSGLSDFPHPSEEKERQKERERLPGVAEGSENGVGGTAGGGMGVDSCGNFSPQQKEKQKDECALTNSQKSSSPQGLKTSHQHQQQQQGTHQQQGDDHKTLTAPLPSLPPPNKERCALTSSAVQQQEQQQKEQAKGGKVKPDSS